MDKDIRLFNDDCLNILPTIQTNLIDLTITSPPYDNLRTYDDILKWNECIWKNVIDELYRITNIGGTVVWIVNDATINGTETGTSFKQALYFKEVGFKLHDTMVWQKPNNVPRNHNRYEPCFEYMFILVKGKLKVFNPIKIPCKNAGKSNENKNLIQNSKGEKGWNKKGFIKKDKPLTNVWNISTNVTGKHPAMFPNKLIEQHIISWSNKNDLVLDPFMGSGTTGVCCKKLNRKFLGIEIYKKYFELAKERIYKTGY